MIMLAIPYYNFNDCRVIIFIVKEPTLLLEGQREQVNQPAGGVRNQIPFVSFLC